MPQKTDQLPLFIKIIPTQTELCRPIWPRLRSVQFPGAESPPHRQGLSVATGGLPVEMVTLGL